MSAGVEPARIDTNVLSTGTVAAIAYSQELENGVGKDPHDEAEVTRLGIPGDRHYGETRWSTSQRKRVPNDRTITVIGADAVQEACRALGIDTIRPGGFGENFLLAGIGDLSEAKTGDELHFISHDGTPGVILHVEDQNPPCVSLRIYHKKMIKQLFGKRGLLCTVRQEGRVRVGDAVRLVRRGE